MVEVDDQMILSLVKSQKTKNQGFKIMMEKFQKPLYSHLRRMLGNHEDTDDVLQNTFIKVYRNIEKFKGESALFSWIYRISTNEAITFINKEKKRNSVEFKETPDGNNIKAEQYLDMERGEEYLKEAIALLPDKQQLVFNMKYYSDTTYVEMSKMLLTSEGALKASFHHAVKKIEAHIKSKMA